MLAIKGGVDAALLSTIEEFERLKKSREELAAGVIIDHRGI